MEQSDFDCFRDMRAKFRSEGWNAAEEHFKLELSAKDKEIERLNEKLAKQQGKYLTISSSREYNYNASCFPKPNGELIIETIIELANSRREKGKYIINAKTDWFMTWKVLHYFKLYTGSQYDFILIVNECVLPYITDAERRKVLSLSNSNFKNIENDNPMKAIPVVKWRKELDEQRDTKRNVQHGTLALDRGVNIMVKLQQLLRTKGIESYNYEK